MAWSIELIENNVTISDECHGALWDLGIFDEDNDLIVEEGMLYFDPDHMEHMDYVSNPQVQAVLAQHRVNGDITFGSLQGDNSGSFWGYRFRDGVLTHLRGQVVFEELLANENEQG